MDVRYTSDLEKLGEKLFESFVMDFPALQISRKSWNRMLSVECH